jgi:hypothetical protein
MSALKALLLIEDAAVSEPLLEVPVIPAVEIGSQPDQCGSDCYSGKKTADRSHLEESGSQVSKKLK